MTSRRPGSYSELLATDYDTDGLHHDCLRSLHAEVYLLLLLPRTARYLSSPLFIVTPQLRYS
ncbi:hypothetical protein E2C01_039190 [Portunus trituberculatus]|uniref:Uncharacterized protein n=1 Tax=Portunus trituberculatus TaxID=210409 RepID=A0A5B7FG76_PORTR|nr:hypothetical protein [Portunus trituberculatus]